MAQRKRRGEPKLTWVLTSGSCGKRRLDAALQSGWPANAVGLSSPAGVRGKGRGVGCGNLACLDLPPPRVRR